MENGREPNRAQRRRKWRRRKKWGLLAAASVLLTAFAGYGLLARRHKPSKQDVPPPGIVSLTPPGIVFHHSFSPGRMGGHRVGIADLSKMHAEEHPGWGQVYKGKTYYIGYHYVIQTNGNVERGRPDLCPGAHARTFNNWLGICLIGDFATHTIKHYQPDHPTHAQIESLISLCESLMAKYHIPPEMIKRHRDVNITWCPGDNFPYAKIMARLTAYAKAHPEMYPTPPLILKIVKPPPKKSGAQPIPSPAG